MVFHFWTVLRFNSCDSVFCNLYLCFVLNRILSVCKTYTLSDKFRVAAFLSARFLTRSDAKDIHLTVFLDWACSVSEHCFYLKHFKSKKYIFSFLNLFIPVSEGAWFCCVNCIHLLSFWHLCFHHTVLSIHAYSMFSWTHSFIISIKHKQLW
jgi:hypothetical protein